MVNVEYLNEYQPLPSFLLDAVDVSSRAANGMQRSGCIGDVTAEDCNQDGACTTDCDDSPCYGDTTDPDCTVDAGCNSDVHPCSSDCSDKPSYTAPSFSVSNITDTGFRVSVSTVGWTNQ